MLRKIHGTNFFHIKFLGHTNITCQIGPVLPPAQVFYGQTLHKTAHLLRSLVITHRIIDMFDFSVQIEAQLADKGLSTACAHVLAPVRAQVGVERRHVPGIHNTIITSI
jgi:hypothetical protein